MMIKGADLSSLSDIERHDGKYYLEGKEEDCIRILRQKGFNMVRLRLFNDPFDENGRSYGAGECDLASVIGMAQRVKEAGMEWLLDFHYSDCWADPGKQTLPKAWRNLNHRELKEAVGSFTKESLLKMKECDVAPVLIAE